MESWPLIWFYQTIILFVRKQILCLGILGPRLVIPIPFTFLGCDNILPTNTGPRVPTPLYYNVYWGNSNLHTNTSIVWGGGICWGLLVLKQQEWFFLLDGSNHRDKEQQRQLSRATGKRPFITGGCGAVKGCGNPEKRMSTFEPLWNNASNLLFG